NSSLQTIINNAKRASSATGSPLSPPSVDPSSANHSLGTIQNNVDKLTHGSANIIVTTIDRASANLSSIQAKANALARTYHVTIDVGTSGKSVGGIQIGHGGGLIHHAGGLARMHLGGLGADEIPAILQRGEYVVQRDAVAQIGVPILD